MLSQGFISANSCPAAKGLFPTSLPDKANEALRVLTFSGAQRRPTRAPSPTFQKGEKKRVGCKSYDQER